MKTSALVAILLWSLMGMGQDVHVSQGKGIVVLSVWAVKPYQLMSGEEKVAIFSMVCTQKGKKSAHVLKFLPGGMLVEDSPDVTAKSGELVFNMTINGTKQMTEWAPSDPSTYAYVGKSDADRLNFIQSLLSSGTVVIEFKPFLNGAPTTSTFDLTKLREEMGKHPECSSSTK
ncbi:MAG: hypothetical protein ACLPPV_09465 [Candidatus Korobacteraceae bacterium]|jgi:hypothetical protein